MSERADEGDDARRIVLHALERHPQISQRALVRRLDISLGKTHYLLQAPLSKGFVKMRNFERSDRKLAYSYLLTPAGLMEKARMTKDFLARKEVEFEALRQTIETLHDELRNASSGHPTGDSRNDLREPWSRGYPLTTP